MALRPAQRPQVLQHPWLPQEHALPPGITIMCPISPALCQWPEYRRLQVQTGTKTAADKQVHKIRQLAGDAIEAFNCD